LKEEVFRLLNLKMKGEYWDSVDLDFLSDEQEWSDDVFTSLIIGANGTGKSYVLSLIVDIFRDLQATRTESKFKGIKRSYTITYQLNNNVFTIENDSKNKKRACRDHEEITISEVLLPKKIIASSFMVTDKFTYAESDMNQSKFYEYLGIRGASTGTGTKTHLKKVGENIIKSSTDPHFINKLKFILSFLDIKSKMTIYFEVRKRKFFNDDINNRTFTDYFLNWRKRSDRITEPFFVKHFNALAENEISNLVDFLNRKEGSLSRINNRLILKYELNLNEYESNEEIRKDFEFIKKLMLLDVLSSPNIEIEKETTFGLEYASSGEYHFIFTMINILSNIEKNSLVLIDEPEMSLHPNWQVNYIGAIKKSFRDTHLAILY